MPWKKKKIKHYTGRTVTWTRSPSDEVFEALGALTRDGPATVLEGIVIKTTLEVQRTDGRIVRVDADRVRVIG
jgi:hypothetical protein